LKIENVDDKTLIDPQNNVLKLSVLKNRLSGTRNISVVSGKLSVGYPNFSVVLGILSVVDIPPVLIPKPEKIQLFMYAHVESFLSKNRKKNQQPFKKIHS